MRKIFILYLFLQLSSYLSNAQTCNNWLSTPSQPSYADIGQINVSGNQLTVEATFNRTSFYSNGELTNGDLVSKHASPSDANYALRPSYALITTTDGFFATPQSCDYVLNKTYHVAMTYDGSTLKYYRDGFMMSSIPATGNLFQNNWETYVGYLNDQTGNENFVGYINEVRIWNVVRTQAQIRAYMNNSLPSPTTQAGLLGYYTFDNLLNKQGNAAFNGTLGGSALINTTNPNCVFIADSCCTLTTSTIDTAICQGSTYLGHNATGTYIDTLINATGCDSIRTLNLIVTNCTIPCNNWLKIPHSFDAVTVGNLNVTGNQVTLEASFNAIGDSAYNLISKHDNPSDCNYMIRPYYGGVTTTTGFYSLLIPCNYDKNKTYHVALVYDGATLKFYRDGFLMAQTAATGNLITNNWPTTIGEFAAAPTFNQPEVFQGYINEVRIWNIARTQTQIRTYMNASLPGPATQAGLLGYYTFNNLLNKQGNATYNGTLVNNASINATNPNCAFVADSCCTPTTSTIDTTICQGQNYLGHNTTGAYIDTLTNAVGCDSIRTLNLTVKNCTVPCNNWLQLRHRLDAVTVGDLDVSGNQITVEAMFNGIGDTLGDLVSKHYYPGNVNYLLRPTQIQINTDNGLYTVTIPCPIDRNKTYQTALVYDGATLKFYRDGYLMGQTPASGNLYNSNDYPTTIGNHAVIFDPTYSYTDTALLTEVFKGYINEVRIWNVARTQAQIQVYMNTSLPNPTTQPGLLAYYTFDNLLNKQGNATYNGTLQGATSSINNVNPNCVFIPDACCPTFSTIDTTICTGQSYLGHNSTGTYIDTLTNAVGCDSIRTLNLTVSILNFDFYYTQDVCNPLSVQFNSAGSDSLNPFFSFGDNITSTGKTNPTHIYSPAGNYTVKYSVKNVNGCTDTLTKIIPVTTIHSDIIITPDTTICYGSTKQLRTKATLDFCWSPVTYLDDPTSPNPITSAPKNIIYHFTSEVQGNNLITNGDFNTGNIRFASNYNYANPNLTEGQYFVGTNPSLWNPGMSSCVDHTGTSGNGNMMMVNGAGTPGVIVWSQAITVIPNTNYAFSAWAQNLTANTTASLLQFSINGNLIGNVFKTNFTTCIWDQFFTTWNSGNATTATISLVNNNLAIGGNDFALDDISFAPISIETDSVIINVDSPVIKTNNDTAICANLPVQLNTTGANTYSWSPATGLSSTSIADPIATPADSTQYIVTGTTIYGCEAKDTVTLSIKSLNIDAGNDSLVCKNSLITLHGRGAGISQYAWTPKASLNDSTLQNPTATIDTTTKFYVAVKNATGCVGKDSVTISVQNLTVKTNNDTIICTGNPLQLNTTGAATYSWLPVTYLSNPLIADPIATPESNIQYIVTGTSSIGCVANDTLSVTVSSLPIVKTNNDTSICKNTSVQLNTTGAISYTWLPILHLSNPGIADPLATPVTSSQYIVTGTDINGCSAKDTVNLTILPSPVITKTNDTSICKNTSVQLFAGGGASYQWSSTAPINNPTSQTPVVTPLVSGTTYYITITGANTCTTNDSVKVSFRADPVFYVSPNQSVCTTDPVQLNAGGGDNYLWSPASLVNNSAINDPLTNINSTTTYSVFIKESTCNNSTTLTTTVTLLPPLDIITTKSNDLDCNNGSAKLLASGASWYRWSPATGLDDTTIANPVASYLSTIKYTVKGSNADGCTGSDTITVYANYADNAAGYYMPNAFTPNGDGINDCFGIKYWGLIEKLEFTIFDRWGNKVFYTNDPAACWDGTYKGKPADAATFVYFIKALTPCGAVERKGNVILIR